VRKISPVLLASFHWSSLGWAALAFFLFAVALGLAYLFFRLGETLKRLSAFINGAERELLPVVAKVGGSVDRVNGQLDKLDVVTDSAVDAVESVDSAVRAVSFAVKTPVKKATGWTAGARYGAAALRARRDWRAALEEAKAAAARREADLEEELRATGARERG
jgi:signal transduction histidine kinase